MKVATLVASVAMLSVVAGCATITRGTTEAWSINTAPSGASVLLSSGQSRAATPCTFALPRNSTFSVTVTKEGYKTWTGQVTHQMSGGGGAGMAGNIILGGLIGAAVDASSGAMMELVPNPLSVSLEPADAPAPAPTPASEAKPTS